MFLCHTTIDLCNRKITRKLFRPKYEISDCATKLCNLVCCMTSLWTASLCLIHRTNTVLHIKPSKKEKKKKRCSGCRTQRGSMNRLFIHQMHPQVSWDIISEMSHPTHSLFQLDHLADATGGSQESQNISTITSFPQAAPLLICHS